MPGLDWWMRTPAGRYPDDANQRYGIEMDFDSLPDIVRRFDLAQPAELEDGQPPG